MNKPILLKLARWLVVLLAVAFLWLKFASDPVSAQPFETVKNAVTSVMNLSAMQEGDNQMVRRFYGLDPAQFEDCALYYPLTNRGRGAVPRQAEGHGAGRRRARGGGEAP